MESPTRSKSKKVRKEKKRRHSTEPRASKKGRKSVGSIKEEEESKRVKFEEEKISTVKCLTFPSKYSTEIKVSVEEEDSATNPVMVSFPAGLPSSITDRSDATNDEDDNHSSPPVFTWTKARQASSKGRLIHGEDSTCTYTAGNEGRAHDGRKTKLYVAIYHKPSNTIKFIPSAEKGTVFALNQTVSSYKSSKSLDFSNLTMNERRRMVFESFGSSKKKKVLRSQDANVVEMRSVVGAGEGMMKALGKQMEDGNNLVSDSNKKVMEELSKKSGADLKYSTTTAIDKAYAEARRAFLPPFDEEASEPYRVYDSQEVAGEDAWGQISRIVDACIHKDDWKEAMQGKYGWPESTSKLLDGIGNPQQKKGTKYQIKTVCLVNYLIRFNDKASKNFMDGTPEELTKFLGLPKSICDRFLELFCAASYDRGRAGYATTKQLKDKRVIYTLVMYLLAHGKEMKAGSIEQLCLDMKIETRDAVSFYREAGCKCVKGKSGHTSISLSVPLIFPNPKRGKKT